MDIDFTRKIQESHMILYKVSNMRSRHESCHQYPYSRRSC
jgi:hypothetical protein